MLRLLLVARGGGRWLRLMWVQLCGMVGIRLMHCSWGEKQQSSTGKEGEKERSEEAQLLVLRKLTIECLRRGLICWGVLGSGR